MPPGGGLSREAGDVAMISQSGGMALNFGHMAGNMGLELSKIFSFGNGCDLDAVALLKYLADDPETTCVAAYLEGVRDGRDFRSVLKALAAEKPTVIWKGGLTPLGSQAARSHTGSLAGEARIWDGILRTPGVASVQGLEEMMDTLSALRHIKSRGTRIALVGGGGAIGVFSSDLAFRWSLEIPTFSPETQKLLKDRFPTPGNSVLNPLDTGTPGLPLEVLIPLLEDIMRREPIQVMVLILLLHAVTRGRPASSKMTEASAPSPAYLENLLAALSRMKKEHGLDVVVAFENWIQDLEVEAISMAMKARYQDEGIAVFPGTARALRAIRNASLVAS
jgi:acyl-CoA synthetase (NDP forming)